MKPIRVVVVGAAGRMGRTIVRVMAETDGVVVSGALEPQGSAHLGADSGALAGIGTSGIAITDDPLPLFANADAVLDFSVPTASVAFAGYAAQARIAHVVGTTGWNAAEEAAIAAAARHAPIVKSGNMSLGVNLLAVLVEQAARALPAADFDIEIVEMHHRHKVDAPSGTALLLGEAAADGRAVALADHARRTRDGHTGARPAGEIGFATLRGGSVVGDHSVILAGPRERIVLTHNAEDREIFARGAIRAAIWAHGRKPGLYSMRDVLGFGHAPDKS